MQIIKHGIFPTMFIIGHRINPEDPAKIQKVGTVIVKGTFRGLSAPAALPKEEQKPIFVRDVPFNFVRNSDFELEIEKEKILGPWQTSGGMPELAESWGIENTTALKLTSNGGQDYLKQTLLFDKPLGGRTFVLSFYAEAKEEVMIDGFSLQAPNSGRRICKMMGVTVPKLPGQPPPPAPPVVEFQRFVSMAETWPADETAQEMEVILPGSGNKDNPVYFDRVQVEESPVPTRWDEDTVFRYEHDLVPYKPYADIIVLGPFDPPASEWSAIMELSTGQTLKKKFTNTEPASKILFGWALRNEDKPKEEEGPREKAAGDLNGFDPKTMKLPSGFNNEFYNGFGWDPIEPANPEIDTKEYIKLNHFADGATFSVHTEPPGVESFQVKLPYSRPTASYKTVNERGNEEEHELPLVLDTVIVEPRLDRYIVVWRGVWNFKQHPEESYVELRAKGGV